MNKSELINVIAAELDVGRADAGKALDAVTSSITTALVVGEDVTISGFGKFSVSERAAREGRNPATGEPLQIPASKVPKFAAASRLREEIQGI